MKKTNELLLSVLIFLSIFTSSCTPKFYGPTTAQTPLFRQKGETQISGHIGSGDEIDNSWQFQVASAIDSNLAVFGSLYKAEGGVNTDAPDDQYGTGSQLELAIGYFNTFTKKLSYEAYGGLAYGNVTNRYLSTYSSNTLGTSSFPTVIQNNCTKPFLQGNIGYRSAYFDAVFNLRVAYLRIGGINEDKPDLDTSYHESPREDINLLKSNPNTFLFEPGVTLRAGFQSLKLQAHLGWSLNSKGNKYPQEGVIFSLGIVGMINSSTKKIKTPHLNF